MGLGIGMRAPLEVTNFSLLFSTNRRLPNHCAPPLSSSTHRPTKSILVFHLFIEPKFFSPLFDTFLERVSVVSYCIMGCICNAATEFSFCTLPSQ